MGYLDAEGIVLWMWTWLVLPVVVVMALLSLMATLPWDDGDDQ